MGRPVSGCLLDAAALFAFAVNEPAADEVQVLLSDSPAMSTVNAAELVDVTVRRGHGTPGDVAASLRAFTDAGLRLVPCTIEIAIGSGRLRSSHYHRSRSAISIADSVALATALSLGVPLATTDQALCTVAAAEGCEVIPLPNSAGRRPKVAKRGQPHRD